MNETQDETRKPSALATLITGALAAALIWYQIPDWQRKAIIAAARLRLRRATARLARASGRRAMGEELAGRTREAETGYGLTYRLSVTRDKL